MLESRATGREVLDQPDCDPILAQREYRFLVGINRFLGGTRAAKRFLSREFRRLGVDELRVLDIGSGGGDIPLALIRWARRNNRRLHITCVENNPTGFEYAKRNASRNELRDLTFVSADVFEHAPQRAYDCAIGSCFFHHLSEREIRQLVAHLQLHVKHSLLISDLLRSRLHFIGGWFLTLPAPRTSRHDALLSIRRGFRPRELHRLLESVDGVSAHCRHAWLFRVYAEARLDGEFE